MQRWQGLADVPDGWDRSVVTIGEFDGVHTGHQRIVRRAAGLAGELALPVVVVTFDCDCTGLLLLLDRRKATRTTTPAITTTIAPLRYVLRRFVA